MKKQVKLEVGTKVRFTEKYLKSCTEDHQKRLRDRVGVVSGYRFGAVSPTITFEKVGRFKELKMFEIYVTDLEVVK
jgi:hypothetical protein